MSLLTKNAEAILWSLAFLGVGMIAFFALIHFASKYTPTPLSNIFDTIGQRASYAGWQQNN